ncbi:hypothetical protein BDW66DRAFT_160081 [Aspergillus desertorum]
MSLAASASTPTIRYEIEVLDDWNGVVDPQKRRTLQNRLNQRAHSTTLVLICMIYAENRRTSKKPCTIQSQTLTERSDTPKRALFLNLDRLSIVGPQAEKSKYILPYLESLFYAEYATGSPRTDLLVGLTRVNFLRALHTNIEILGYSAAEMHDDALSQFETAGPMKDPLRLMDSASFPASLQPTPIQSTVPHHPWLDLLPIPQMRDNLILAEAGFGEGYGYDDVQLCRDMCGYGTPSLPADRQAGNGEAGIIIWGDPWDPEG